MKKLLFSDRDLSARLARLVLLAAPLLSADVCLDNDFWFIINHGRYILQHGFATVEPFTVHTDLAFSFEKWLTCIVFYKVYDWFGPWGMYAFMLAVFAAVIWIFHRVCLLFSRGNELVSLVLTIVFMCFLGDSFIRTRPQIFSYFFLLAGLWCLERYALSGAARCLLPLPALAFLYMQFHSTMLPIFFIIMLPYLCDFGWVRVGSIQGSRYRKWPILAAMAACVLAAMVNPYGVRSVVYLFRSLQDGGLLSTINEVHRSSFRDILAYSGGVLVCQVLYLLLCLFRRERFPLRYFFMLLGTFAMALYAVRNNAFYVLMGGAVCAWELRRVPARLPLAPTLKKAAAVAAVALAVVMSTHSYDLMARTHGYRALDELRALCPEEEVRLYTNFNCGSYAEWLGFRCYADPRAEVFLKSINGREDILAEIWASNRGGVTAAALQEKYHFDYWLVPKGYSLDRELGRNRHAEQVVETDGFLVYRYHEEQEAQA